MGKVTVGGKDINGVLMVTDGGSDIMAVVEEDGGKDIIVKGISKVFWGVARHLTQHAGKGSSWGPSPLRRHRTKLDEGAQIWWRM